MTGAAAWAPLPGAWSVAPLKPEQAWLRSARIFALESWWPPFWPHIEVDWDKALWTMKRLHLDTLQANALTKWACYQTKLVKPHPELGGRDLLREAQDFCAKNGFKWIIYSLFGHAMPISTQLSREGAHAAALFRPLLKSREAKTAGEIDTVPPEFHDYSTRFHFGDERYVAHCVFASEGWLLNHIRELAGRYDYHACWIDGGVTAGEGWSNDNFWNVCCCHVCQKAYLDDYKRPMPLVDNAADPRLLALRRWVFRRLDGVLERVSGEFTRNRRLPIVGNMASGMGMASFHPPILRHYQGGLFEHAPDTLQLAVNLRLSRQITGVAIHYPDCYDPWPRKVTSGWEVENKGLLIAAYGGTPYLAQPGKYYYDASKDEPARRIFEFMEKQRTLLDQQEECALYAVATQPAFYRSPLSDNALSGWYGALLDDHAPVTAASFHQLEDLTQLKRYAALILPHTEYLSSQALPALRAYVEGGGGLYLGCDVGKVDENRKPRKEALADFFDLRPWNPSREQLLRRHHFDGRFEPEGGRDLNYTYEVYMKWLGPGPSGFPMPEADIQPTYLGHQVPGSSWTVLAAAVPTDRDEPLMPLLAARTVGAGRMIYSGASWGHQYYQRRDPSLASWMAQITAWLGGGKSLYRLSASRSLLCAPARVKDGWLFYLINNSNDIQGKRQDWGEMMKVWERPFPIGKVELRVPGASKAEAVYGPSPDSVSTAAGGLEIAYRNFAEHVVLLVRAS
jgi:hypothetical protein